MQGFWYLTQRTLNMIRNSKEMTQEAMIMQRILWGIEEIAGGWFAKGKVHTSFLKG